ncbi:FkbM family methyltransferase [Bernardetia sp.]|uniref:FkbM family methyltransferase n=1 Tax=Bernardetia sp. TaxID=1937974 RepID=UPI0025B7FF27|nr:FkbM family methyltransferase [Bernardetia sp.]
MSILTRLLPTSLKEKLREKLDVPDMFRSISKLKNLGFDPKMTVDIGAYKGEWTKEMQTIFPNSKFLMVEPMSEKATLLEKMANQSNGKIYFEQALLAAEANKEVIFHQSETASSVLTEHEENDEFEKVSKLTTTLALLLEKRNIGKIDFLKIDTQGYELEILKGATEYLKNTDVVLLEVSLLDIHQNVPLVHEVCNFMYQYGFVTYDICSFTRRPLDKALWQSDFIFVKENSSFRANKNWI